MSNSLKFFSVDLHDRAEEPLAGRNSLAYPLGHGPEGKRNIINRSDKTDKSEDSSATDTQIPRTGPSVSFVMAA